MTTDPKAISFESSEASLVRSEDSALLEGQSSSTYRAESDPRAGSAIAPPVSAGDRLDKILEESPAAAELADEVLEQSNHYRMVEVDEDRQANFNLRAIRLILTALLGIVVVYSLWAASSFFLPIFYAFLLSQIFAPLVRKMASSWHVPAPASALLVLALFLASAFGAAYLLAEPVGQWMSEVPGSIEEASAKLSEIVHRPMEQVNEAAEKMEKVTQGTDDGSGVQSVRIQEDSMLDTVVEGTQKFLSAVFVVGGMLYFLLASGDRLIRSVVKVLPPGEQRRKALGLGLGVEMQISQYLALITTINFCLGLAIGTSMWLLGMPNPILWGVMGMLFNYVPYLGAVTGVGVVTIVGLATFDAPSKALLAGGIYLALTLIEGNFITPSVLGERFRINPVFVFLWLIFCAFLWGAPGALLAVPILTVIKIVSEQFDSLAKFDEILSS